MKPTVIDSESCIVVMEEASSIRIASGCDYLDAYLFARKMWIKGLQILRKPLCHCTRRRTSACRTRALIWIS